MLDELIARVGLFAPHTRPARLSWVIMALMFARPVLAQSGSLEFDGGRIGYSIYAPQWIWQRQNINILVVFESDLSTTATVGVTLHYPPYHADRFAYDGPTSQRLVLAPGGRGRLAFANMLARAEKQLPDGRRLRFRPAVFLFTLDLRAESVGKKATVTVGYPVRTVRGAVVRQGPLAMWLPVILILFWCGLVFLVVPRMAQRGAWRRPSEPIEDAGED